MKKKLIDYIKKSHLKAVEKFNEELKAWAKETGEEQPTLYEDINTSFTLADIAVSDDGTLFYTYDGKQEFVVIVCLDEETDEYYEDEGIDGIMEYIKFWRKCLKRAKSYWSKDPDELDAMADGEMEDIDDNDEED